jgi:Anti-sigma-K factor rskA, C-terminal/Putative zinc-finger
MNCAEIHPNLAAFVLRGLEPEEAAEVEVHLASCPGCTNELRELQKVNRALDAAPSSATPPAYLKDEILSRVRAEELSTSNTEESEASSTLEEHTASSRTSRFDRFKVLRIILPSAAAAAFVAILALGIVFGPLREEPPVATIQLVPTPQEAAGLHGYWGVAEIRPQPSGNQQVELKLNNFEQPKPDSYYELWFVSGESRISAGSFTSVGKGETRVLLNAPPETRNYHTLLITEEHFDERPVPGVEVALKGELP